jgi:hypothetical protein
MQYMTMSQGRVGLERATFWKMTKGKSEVTTAKCKFSWSLQNVSDGVQVCLSPTQRIHSLLALPALL